jgi:ferritin-like protein
MKPTTNPTDLGANRTGIASSPKDGDKLIEGARQGVPRASFTPASLEAERLSYNDDAEPVGTVPPPASIKGAVKAVGKALVGEKATVLIDQMAGRLAFERTGTRLYEALLTKLQAAGEHPGGPTRTDLEEIRDEELAHAALLADGLVRLGADPTSMTPAADVTAVASEGVLKVVVDARTTLTQSLEAILIAELTDNDAWTMLVNLADKMGQDELAAEFREALLQEEDHLDRVRTWLQDSLEGQAGVAGKAPAATPPPAPIPPG